LGWLDDPHVFLALLFAAAGFATLLTLAWATGALYVSRSSKRVSRATTARVGSSFHDSAVSAAESSACASTPRVDAPPRPQGWRRDHVLVAIPYAVLSQRCVFCNAPAERLWLREFRWTPPAWELAHLAGHAGAIASLCAMRGARLQFGVCAAHHQRERRSMLAMCALGVAGVLVGSFGVFSALPWLCGGAGAASVLAALVILCRRSSAFAADRIDRQYVEVRGAGPAFLASLPHAGCPGGPDDPAQHVHRAPWTTAA
jgi:hypothetical protein